MRLPTGKSKAAREQRALLLAGATPQQLKPVPQTLKPKGNNDGQAPTDRRISETVPQHAQTPANEIPPAPTTR